MTWLVILAACVGVPRGGCGAGWANPVEVVWPHLSPLCAWWVASEQLPFRAFRL
jgi:hypothetical protein